MPSPRPISSQRPRASAVASRSRGNHSRGTVSERPSSRCTTSASGMNSIVRARASGALTIKDFMPPLQKPEHVIPRQLAHPPQLGRREPARVRQLKRRQPQLRDAIPLADVNVGRLLILVAEEEKPKALD